MLQLWTKQKQFKGNILHIKISKNKYVLCEYILKK